MGVPKFFRWLSEKYPLINEYLSSGNTPTEFDNLYLDMNGIIHNCSHPHDENVGSGTQLTFKEIVENIYHYLDHIVSEIVKPQKLLFLAIDGVAPRAKLNQQRARRFRAAQDREENYAKALRKREIAAIDTSTLFDSNCITPGTEFMELLNRHLKYFIRRKIKEDKLWQRLTIIYSGHDVPGEGEHKIMQFLREYRQNTQLYNPNTRHCMYGQDADLIMLGLACHEINFALLREVQQWKKSNRINNGNSGKHHGKEKKENNKVKFHYLHISILREYIIFDFINGLQYSGHYIQNSANHSNNEIDPEKIIDDFIFLTFFVGNDFLPSLPSLAIREDALTLMMEIWKELYKEKPGYLVNNRPLDDNEIHLDFERLEQLLKILTYREEQRYQQKENDNKKYSKRRGKWDRKYLNEQLLQEQQEKELQLAFNQAVSLKIPKEGNSEEEVGQISKEEHQTARHSQSPKHDHLPRYLRDRVKGEAVNEEGENNNSNSNSQQSESPATTNFDTPSLLKKREQKQQENTPEKATTEEKEEEDLLPELVFEEGEKPDEQVISEESLSSKNNEKFINEKDIVQGKDYRGRYYFDKFHFLVVNEGYDQTNNIEIRSKLLDIASHYLAGLQWCIAYYLKGCISWNWFYPYHYAPMLSDLTNLTVLNSMIHFEKGKPFSPFEQLLGCLPPASAHLLPACYQWLMVDSNSPIIDFYPRDFSLDLNGKRANWEAVVLLDFIDEKRLIDAEREFCLEEKREAKHKLTTTELERNKFGKIYSFIYDSNVNVTYPSCNRDIGFPDISQCHSKATPLNFTI